MFSALVQRIISVRAALSLYSLPARHLLLTSRRLADLLVHRSANASCIMGHWSFSDRLRSLVLRTASNEQPRDRNSWLFASRCLLVTAGCSLLLGLAGCGPVASDNAPNPGPRASVSGPAASEQDPPPGNDSITPVTPKGSPVPLASGNKKGHAEGKGAVTGGESLLAASASSMKPADTIAPAVVPAWMAKELDSPDARVRLRALETGCSQRLREWSIG